VKILTISAFIVLASAALLAAGETQLTVYNSNLGLVREKRTLTVEKGIQKIDITDIAAMIDPTSLHFKSLTAPDELKLLEQNFEYDLISKDKLLQKYIGEEIGLERYSGPDSKDEKKETITGTLLSIRDGLVIRVKDKILLNPRGEISLSRLPEELIMKPTLSLQVENSKQGLNPMLSCPSVLSGVRWNNSPPRVRKLEKSY
jgi:hypothetical protein